MGRTNYKEDDKTKWIKIISFIIAIALLGVAITISMTKEKKVAETNYNNLKGTEEDSIMLQTEQASSDLSKNINQVMGLNKIEETTIPTIDNARDNNVTNETKNTIATNANINTNEVNVENQENNQNENQIQEQVENKSEEITTKSEFIFPVEGDIIKEFAKDNLIYSETLEEWITHTGIDIKAEKASVVKAVANGTVKSIKNDPRYGLTVTIEHSNGFVSSYSSLLTAEFVKEGEKVTQGQTIGTVGNSAVFEVSEDSHLHFELIKDGSNINPEIYLK